MTAEETLNREVQQALNWLASNPGRHNTAVPTKVLRRIMLETGGWMLACGQGYDIKVKNLGAGVHRLTLERK